MKHIPTYLERLYAAGVLTSPITDTDYVFKVIDAMRAETAELRQAIFETQPVYLPDALNSLLWLYRRLPKGYGSVPHIDNTALALSRATGVDVGQFLNERRGSEDANCHLLGGSCRCVFGDGPGCVRMKKP